MRKRYLLMLLLAFSTVFAIAQPVTINPPSATIQPGQSVTLTASGAVYYQWSPATGLSTTEGPVTVASPTVTTTYTCEGYAPGDESVVNGNFNQGNTGFTSAYEYSYNLWNEGTYYVDADASQHHENFHGYGHGDNGNFMMVNGSISPGTNVWTEQITVHPNKWYAFSTWACTLAGVAGQMALLQFSINGTQLGEVFSAPSQTMVWEQFYELWYSGNTTTATITILNQNTNGDGNDFGLDDISFRELVLVGDPTCTVNVGSMSATATAEETELCEGESTTLHALPVNGSGNYSYSWTPSNTLDNPTSQHPLATPSVGTTTYTCQIEDVDWNNTVEVGVTVTVYAQPVADAGEDQSLPYPGLTATLNGSGGSDSYTYRWEPANMVVDPDSPSTQTVVLNETQDYELTVTNPQGQCISTDQVTVFIGTSALIVSVETPDPICENESAQLQVYASGASGNFRYSWAPTTGLSNPTIPNPVASPTQTTSYTCTITDNIAGYTRDINVTVTVNHPDYMEDIHVKDSCNSVHINWQGQDTIFYEDTQYKFIGETEEGCYREQTYHIENMKYSPSPTKIHPKDSSTVWSGIPDPNALDTAYVVTNTEFFSFQYIFRIEETYNRCVWDEDCHWTINKPSWVIEYDPTPKVDNGKYYSECTVYVAEHDDDIVVLTATAKNGCDSIQRKIYLKSSFLDIDEQNIDLSVLSIVPNPNNGQMTLIFNHFEGKVGVKVYDVMGNLMDSFETYNDMETKTMEYQLDGSKGIYFIVANGKEGTIAKKVVIR